MCKNQQSNSPYLSRVLKHNFSINQSSNSYHLCHKKIIVWIFEYGNSVILELGKMGAKSITVCLIELLLVTVDWTELLLTNINISHH